MKRRTGWGMTMAALGAAGLVAGTLAAGTAQAAKREAPSLETLLVAFKTDLTRQGQISFGVTSRDAHGALTETPETDAVVYSTVTWEDRCVLKVKSTFTVQDTIDEGWHEGRPVEETIDLHALKSARAQPYAAYLTNKGLSGPKARPEVRFTVNPREITAVTIEGSDAVLIAIHHGQGQTLINDLKKAAAVCAAEVPSAG